MKANHIINTLLIFLTLNVFISYSTETKSNKQYLKVSKALDTTLVKHKNELNKFYEVGFYSRSYSYYWITGNDTLDFSINAMEYEKDSTIHLNILHTKPLLFSSTLLKIKECFPLIKEDFNLSKLNSLFFRDLIYYSDVTKELSIKYKQQFGHKQISYEKLNQFLLNSQMNNQLDFFIKPFDKKIKRYSIEKFHLIDKRYLIDESANVDLTDFAQFVLHGSGLYVELQN